MQTEGRLKGDGDDSNDSNMVLISQRNELHSCFIANSS